MQVSSEKKEGIKHLLTVTVPADDVKKAYQVSFVKYAKNAKIDGFRKGHIPTNVLEQQFGSQIFADVRASMTSQGYDYLSLYCEKENAEAIAFWRSQGFNIDKEDDYRIYFSRSI